MEKFNFPGVIGAVDGTHIPLLKPAVDEHNFINRKGFHSLNAQIICDADLRILSVNANWPGSSHDSFVWRNSQIKRHLLDQHNRGELRGSWLIGDSGYPLQPILITPVSNPPPNSPQSNFNKAHIQARNTVERCIGVLKTRFRCLLRERTLRYEPRFIGSIMNACCVLHNLCIEYGVELDEEVIVQQEVDNAVDDPGDPDENGLLAQGVETRNRIITNYFQ